MINTLTILIAHAWKSQATRYRSVIVNVVFFVIDSLPEELLVSIQLFAELVGNAKADKNLRTAKMQK